MRWKWSVLPIALGLLTQVGLRAERRPLEAPDLPTFEIRQHMSKAYREEVDVLCAHESNSAPLVSELCDVLLGTLDQPKLIEALEKMETLGIDDQEWREKLAPVATSIREGHYTRGVPIEFQKLGQQGWEIKWRRWDDESNSWTGPVEVRRLTPIPHMVIRVVASVAEGNGRMRFGYGLRNSAESTQKINSMEVECVGLTRERSSELEKVHQMPSYTRDHLVNGRLIAVSLPSFLSERPVFSLWSYDPTTQRLFAAKPGETLELAPVLEVPWSSLPGVVRSWVEMPEYPYPLGLDAERDPEEVQEIVMAPVWEDVSVGRPVRFPRWEYHGKSIGPVPTPDEGTPRVKWVDQLVAWHREARKWGWYDKGGEEVWETRAAELKADPSDRRIHDLLAKSEEDHEAGRLLEETYALWRYNLEYLLKMPQ